MHLQLFLLMILCVLCYSTTLDMTHIFNEKSLYWPDGQQSFHLRMLSNGSHPDGYWYQSDEYASGIHLGTHMDAPVHFARNHWSIDEIPPEHLVAPVVMVDIRHKLSPATVDVNLTTGDLIQWEMTHGPIPAKSIVLMCSGWSDKYPDKLAVFGNDQDNLQDFHFPGFDSSAVELLIEKRQIVGIGVDTPSVDYGPSTQFSTHVTIGTNDVFGLEYVKDVCKLPAKGATLYCFPSKIEHASGAPVRIFARWNTDGRYLGTGSAYEMSNSESSNLMSNIIVTTIISILLVIFKYL